MRFINNENQKNRKVRKLVTENMSKEDMVKEAVEEAKAKAAKEQAEAEADSNRRCPGS